jgi:deoxyadenosine/deoxycytidine kinase
MALLGAKAMGIRAAFEWGGVVVVDRSIQEDIEVFADYFLDEGFLDQRAFRTYEEYARFLIATVPEPDVVVYCQCEPDECARRVEARPRPYQQLYPPDFVNALHRRYEQWWSSTSAPSRIVVDTELVDLRRSEIAREFINFIGDALSALPSGSRSQLSLFEVPDTTPALPNITLTFRPGRVLPRRTRTAMPSPDAPVAYLAAPFTAVATEITSPTSPSERLLLDLDEPHGSIPTSPYRETLLKASDALVARGFRTLLPHRDINRWGARLMQPGAVARECLQGVRASSLVVALLSTSFGAHAEVAAAIAWGIPVVIVHEQNAQESFFATALRQSGLCSSISISRLSELPIVIASERFEHALSSAIYARSALRLRGGSKA